MLQRFTRNTIGRDLIVGDIHGFFSKLQDALDGIAFDPARDRLFSVGDLVDRGPESDHVHDWLAKPWFHAVMGNHEAVAIMFAQGRMPAPLYMRGWGGGWNVANPQAEQQRLADLFSSLPLAIELETERGLVGIVHADFPLADWAHLEPALAAGGLRAEAIVNCLLESRDRVKQLNDDEVAGVRAVVVGHTPHERMTSLGNVLYIDTYAWRRGHYTIIDAATLRPVEPVPERALDWS